MEHERWIRSAVAYIERHLTDDVDFDDVARHTAVSRFHLHRVFQQQLGFSAASYLRERRLARAAADLLHTNKRILDIALEYRFAGQDSFTRTFKRIRLNGFLKTEGVRNWGGLWMRVDGKDEEVLSFDNMEGRPIQGTTEWALYSIVLDVPLHAEAIAFGAFLCGPGHVWMDGLRFEEVDESVPTTDIVEKIMTTLPDGPINLDFEARDHLSAEE
ncbi:helix-turn-helix domain-containing protein [Paenibacillus apiarius]|uniref:AraC family transcriptional regulator n=1 Tax=Paenibacillus apiarius TaxID=46240 RepID=A0ABT4E3N8_9BACL|nr:AraC family transcriptional regulator [Paenibacillus apiarius]MCY9516622.1 AraC family transcriptional regulator [Paenibacillus apiarius]MCY9522841.1 AraC family transcriptional regulator [Paenibacillus apiarius]MCY9550545.1 AraC family transcriptional regulator [Paenibacillus apiarius]MCY9560810.1 AraC family transcriptional regulator [Paenibacillus apiarius]MCY9685321.1 AraC family transcriptional regulator [Paenibacillus apiarius]